MSREQVLGVWAWSPQLLAANARRRRLTLVGLCASGVSVALLGAQVWHDLRWFGLGVVIVVIALMARRRSEPRFLAWEAAAANALSTEESSHEC